MAQTMSPSYRSVAPRARVPDLERHRAWRRQLHERDLADGMARAALPD
jgi:hypothetical protein